MKCAAFFTAWRRLLVAGALLLFLPAPAIQALLLDRQEARQPVSDGVALLKIRQFEPEGWLNVVALEIDLTNPDLDIQALHAGDRITAREPVSRIARRHEAVAATNADFFYIGQTDAPLGIHVQDDRLVKTPAPGRERSFGISAALEPFIDRMSFEAAVTIGENTFPISGINSPAVPTGAVVLFDRRWGETAAGTQTRGMEELASMIHAVVNADGTVAGLHTDGPGPEIPENGFVLAGGGEGAEWLKKHVRPGAYSSLEYAFSPDAAAAVGGNPLLLRDGRIQPDPGGPAHPRTAVGYSEDRQKLWLVVIDGRSPMSRGVTLYELAEWMRGFGAHDALNLDGGGSSTLVARRPGGTRPVVHNLPSDGGERTVPNALGILMSAPTGPLHQLFIDFPAPRRSYPLTRNELRVAPGTEANVPVSGADRHLNPVPVEASDLEWEVEPAELGEFSAPGRFRGMRAGSAVIRASLRAADEPLAAAFPVRVIGEPASLEIEPLEISTEPEQQVTLRVFAVDREGYRAPLSHNDVSWEIRGGVGEVRNERFTASPDAASGAVVAHFEDAIGAVRVGVGGEPEAVTTFEVERDWRVRAVPEMVSAAFSANPDAEIRRGERPVGQLAYNFEGSTRTRAAYLHPAEGDIHLPRRPLRLGLWVFGDGNGSWLRAQILDGFGVIKPIDFARRIDWEGWRYVEAEVPPETDYPIALRSIYVAEIRGERQHAGQLYFDRLSAVYAPEADPSMFDDIPVIPDAANRPPGEKTEPHFRFAVFGDSKVQAGNSDSIEVRLLRRSIDRINAEEGLEFAVFTGDLVENDSEPNYRFGKELLDELQTPYHVAVANHEIAGTDSLARFREFFGPTYHSFVHGNSRFIFLNAARPGLRVSEAEQWPWLKEELRAMEERNLFVTVHTPLIDPLPGSDTSWTDPLEIGLFQSLMSRAREMGRNVFVFHGHVHGFHSRLFDGVRYITSAGSGSSLYLPPNRGGFYHYLVVTVAGGEVSYRVIPLLDRIDVPERLTLKTGESAPIEAMGVGFAESVRFPLRYPAAVEWRLSGDGIGNYDLVTGIFHATRAGTATLELSSGGVGASTRIDVRSSE